MRRRAVWIVAAVITLCGLTMAHAQEASKTDSDNNKTKAERPNQPVHAYRVDFSINEMEAGKKINTRHYTLNENSGAYTMLSISSRVSVATPEMPHDTLEIGTHINCSVKELGEDIALDVHSDFSNFFSPDEQHSTRPVFRHVDINGSTLATPGKPVVIGALDDPSSDRQFQLEATVTRLK